MFSFQIILANTGDPQASHLASKLSETVTKVSREGEKSS